MLDTLRFFFFTGIVYAIIGIEFLLKSDMLDTLRFFFFTGMISANSTVQHGIFTPLHLRTSPL
jgi:hypothetical protein